MASRRRAEFARGMGLAVGLLTIAAGAVCAAAAPGGQPQPSGSPAASAPDAAGPAATPPSQADLADAVRQLGDPAYAVRRTAGERLLAAGPVAQTALEAGLKSPDAEIQRRCRWLLERIWAADFRQRTAAFAADKQGEADHGMPGWQRYRRAVGNDAPARELFLEMVKAEGPLLEATAAGGPQAAEALAARWQQALDAQNNSIVIFDTQEQGIPLGTMAALIWVASDPQTPLPDALNDSELVGLLENQPAFERLVKKKRKFTAAGRKLLGQWAIRPAPREQLYAKMDLVLRFDLDAGLGLAIRIVRDRNEDGVQQAFGGAAAEAVGRFGGKPYARLLQELLDDAYALHDGGGSADPFDRRSGNKRKGSTTEIRDVALAWLVHLTGQDHAAYGQPLAKQAFAKPRSHDGDSPDLGLFGFVKKTDREEAIKKLRAWLVEHPLPELPEIREADLPRVLPNPEPKPEPAEPANVPAVKPLPGRSAWPVADRALVRNVSLARELAARGQFGTAARLADEVLGAETAGVFLPERKLALVRNLRAEAERLVGSWPDKGRQVYIARCGAEAREMLSAAIRAGDAEGIAAVAARYFHTPAGAEAAWLVARRHEASGDVLRAADGFDHLRRDAHDAARFEPALSLRLAACWLQLGMARQAQDTFGELTLWHPKLTATIAGRVEDLSGLKAGQRLRSLLGPSAESADAQPPVFSFAQSQTAATEADLPLPQLTPLPLPTPGERIAKQIEKLRKADRDQHRAAPPGVEPLIVGRMIVLRTATQLVALDALSGALAWETPLEDPLAHYVGTRPPEPPPKKEGGLLGLFRNLVNPEAAMMRQFENEAFAASVRHRLWRDASFGRLTTDGRRVFGVEGLYFALPGDYQRLAVGPDGRRRLEAGQLKTYNLLTAYDIATGRLVWEQGGPPALGSPLADTQFLGPPLPLAGRLYVLAENRGATQLLELDSATGQLRSALTLLLRPATALPPELVGCGLGVPLGIGMDPLMFLRPGGAGCARAEGVLLCHTGEGEFFAVDLASRMLLWAYPLTDLGSDQPSEPEEAQPPWWEMARDAAADGWLDTAALVAGDRVLLTLRKSQQLECLNLRDGRRLWTAPRRDGLYLGAVFADKVLVVDRSGLRALRLADGQPAWPHERLLLPDGALPAGRGAHTAKGYLLPLSNAEVLVVDIERGRIAGRARGGAAPGPATLLACSHGVFSHSVDSLARCTGLAQRSAEVEAALGDRPDDPQLLLQRAELLLAEGRIETAVQLLRGLCQRSKSGRASALLAEALVDGLRADFARFEQQAAECAPLLPSGESRARLQRETALGLERAGRRAEAFALYLQLLDAEPAAPKVERFETAREVRRDRWLTAHLAAVYEAATAAERAEFDRRIAARCAAGRQRAFVAAFGWHPSSHAARLQLAPQAAAEKRLLEAEFLLREVLEHGSPPQRREAIARLAALLREAQRPVEAARFYAALGGEFADAVCVDGKKGADLLAALKADDPVRRRLAMPDPWPAAEPQKESGKRVGGVNGSPLPLVGEGGEFGVVAALESGDGHIAAADSLGRRLWRARSEAAVTTIGFDPFGGGYESTVSRALNRGHLFVVALASEGVCAFDGLSDRTSPLWSRTADPRTWTEEWFGGGALVAGFNGPAARGLPGSEPLRAALCGDCVCFQQGARLFGVSALGGETLWMRDDLPPGCDLFGDGDLLLVTPPDGAETVALSPWDGRELGHCAIGPLEERLWTRGRCVIAWRSEVGRTHLSCTDPWQGQVRWRREFPAGAAVYLCDAGQAAVHDPAGRLAVVELATGRTVFAAQADPTEKIEHVVARPSATRWLLAVDHGGAKTAQGFGMFPALSDYVPINGRVYSFDRKTGKQQWTADVQHQLFQVCQPADLPVLTFLNSVDPDFAERGRGGSRLVCLDARTGKVLHEQTAKDVRTMQFSVVGDPDAGRVELATGLGNVTFRYAAAPK